MSQDSGTPPEAAIDGHAEEIVSEQQPVAPPATALGLAARPPADREVLMPLDPERVVEGMRQYQRAAARPARAERLADRGQERQPARAAVSQEVRLAQDRPRVQPQLRKGRLAR
jgi:hypothetical protein